MKNKNKGSITDNQAIFLAVFYGLSFLIIGILGLNAFLSYMISMVFGYIILASLNKWRKE